MNPHFLPEIIEALRGEGVELLTAMRIAPVVAELAAAEAHRLLTVAAGTTEFSPLTQLEDPVRLSPRELEVLHMLAARKSYKEIGAALGRSTETIKSHVGRAFRKLGISSSRDVESALRRVNPNSPSRGTTVESGKGGC